MSRSDLLERSPSGLPVTRPRLSEAERRQALIRAAESVFLAQGYAAANMDDVARGARMSKKTLYQLFSSKEALFEAVMTEHLAPLQEVSPEEAAGDLREGLVTLIERAATHLLNERHIGFFRLISAEVKRAPELAEAFHRAVPTQGKGALERCLTIHAARGDLNIDDPAEAAGMLFGLAIGEPHMRMILGQRDAPTREEVSRRVSNAVEIFLNGTLIRKRPRKVAVPSTTETTHVSGKRVDGQHSNGGRP